MCGGPGFTIIARSMYNQADLVLLVPPEYKMSIDIMERPLLTHHHKVRDMTLAPDGQRLLVLDEKGLWSYSIVKEAPKRQRADGTTATSDEQDKRPLRKKLVSDDEDDELFSAGGEKKKLTRGKTLLPTKTFTKAVARSDTEVAYDAPEWKTAWYDSVEVKNPQLLRGTWAADRRRSAGPDRSHRRAQRTSSRSRSRSTACVWPTARGCQRRTTTSSPSRTWTPSSRRNSATTS
jgi:hypothetical protein